MNAFKNELLDKCKAPRRNFFILTLYFCVSCCFLIKLFQFSLQNFTLGGDSSRGKPAQPPKFFTQRVWGAFLPGKPQIPPLSTRRGFTEMRFYHCREKLIINQIDNKLIINQIDNLHFQLGEPGHASNATGISSLRSCNKAFLFFFSSSRCARVLGDFGGLGRSQHPAPPAR